MRKDQGGQRGREIGVRGLPDRPCQAVEYVGQVFGLGVVFRCSGEVIKERTCLGVEVS